MAVSSKSVERLDAPGGRAIDVVGFVASAGGLDALSRVLRELPSDFEAAIVVAQHLSGHGSRLVEILRRRVGLPIEWARDGSELGIGRVTVAPPRAVLEVLPDGTCAVSSLDRGINERPLDTLLRSLADSYGERAMGVVLTGMGSDGGGGTAALQAAGATVIAQSEETAEQPAMPRAASAAGAQLVLPLDDIASVVVDVVRGAPVPRSPAEIEASEQLFAGPGEIRTLLRRMDWSASALGPVTSWPDALKVMMRIVLDSAQPMAIWWGPELVMLYNEAYRAFMGEAKHPSLGDPAREVWSEIWDRIQPLIDAVLRGEGVAEEDWRVNIRRDGALEEIFATFSYSPILDANGSPVGIYNPAWETTQKVVAERRLRLLSTLTATLADARTRPEAAKLAASALDSDPDDIPFALIYLAEAPAQQMLLGGAAGVEAGSFAAPRVMRLDREDARWPLARALDSDEAVFVGDLRTRIRGLSPAADAPTGTQSPTTATLRRLHGAGREKPSGVVVLGVSPHRPLDAAHVDFLELVCSQIAAGLDQAETRQHEKERLTRLADVDREKTEFYSNVSHEFRTPLTLMVAPLEERLRRGDALPSDLRDELELVTRNARRLLRLVGTMLDFSQIEARRLHTHFVPTDLAERTREIVALFESAIASAGLELHLNLAELPAPVWVDVEMWEKIVSNLISNALKFTFDGVIEITLRALPKHAELVVRDTGVGIPEQELPHVFKRFHRVRGTRARTQEGAGIGLALANELARRHHGRIRVASTVGEGTTFTVWIPLERRPVIVDSPTPDPSGPPSSAFAAAMAEEALAWADAARADRPTADALDDSALNQSLQPYAPGARILAVDDNHDMRAYLARLLGEHWHVTTAGDGEEALALIRDNPPDLVVADVMMPALDGFGLLAELRADDALRATPVVLLTARAGEETAIEGLLAGADDYIVKPFSARELLARIGGQLELARSRRRTA